jgi:tetratricopeptide (TPR) repeat protein/S1-C subfamily serine protease
VLRKDRRVDLALVETESLPEGIEALRLSNEPARPGDRVHAVGCRYDLDALWAYTAGTVSQTHALKEGYFSGGKELAKGAHVVIADAPVNEGDSGGPLVNDFGDVVGVTAAVDWDARGAGLFIAADEVRALAGMQSGPFEERSSVGRDIYRRGLRTLALVRGDGDGRASAVVIDRDRRLLLTTADAVGARETAMVVFPVFRDGALVADEPTYHDSPRVLNDKHAQTTATVLAADARRNLALLEAAALPVEAVEARLAPSPPVPGDGLHALSCPARGDLLWLYTACFLRQRGHVKLGRTSDGPDPAVLAVQAPLTPGDGGGPVFNDRGDLVGVASGKTGPQQQVAYVLTAEEIRGFLDENRVRWAPAAALVARAAVFVKARQFDRAIADLDAATQFDSHFAPAVAERGHVRYLQGDDAEAIRDCDRALELDAKSAMAHVWRAAARRRLGDSKGARADCDAALAADPHNATALAIRGDVRRVQGDLDGALADCDEAVWLDRRLPSAHLQRGAVYEAKDDPLKAIEEYSQALRLDADLADAYRRRGDCYWARSDGAAALADYTHAAALDPKDAAAQHGRGRALAARGDHDAALAAFDAALKLDSGGARIYRDRGAERLRGGDAPGGLSDLVEASRLNPALTADMLQTIERQAAKEPPAAACALCRRALTQLRALTTKDVLPKVIDEQLAAAEAESDLERRADKMRSAITLIQNKLR